MFKFLETIAAKREQAKADLAGSYPALIRKGASGTLTPAESAKLDQLAKELGISLDQINTDTAAVVRYRSLKAAASNLADLRTKYFSTIENHRRHVEETRLKDDQRQKAEAGLYVAIPPARKAMDDSAAAAMELSTLETRYADLLGDEVAPSKPVVACVLPPRDQVRDAHKKELFYLDGTISRQEREWMDGGQKGSRPLPLEKQTEQTKHRQAKELALHDQLEVEAKKMVAKGAILFQAAINPDVFNVDMKKYDFRALPGQPESEFAAIVQRMQAAADARDSRPTFKPSFSAK